MLSVLVDPDLDLLLGFGGVFLILVGGVVGTLAGREEDQMDRRSVAGGAAAGAAVGAMFFSSNRCLEPCWRWWVPLLAPTGFAVPVVPTRQEVAEASLRPLGFSPWVGSRPRGKEILSCTWFVGLID